jgi:hypothetical protein
MSDDRDSIKIAKAKIAQAINEAEAVKRRVAKRTSSRGMPRVVVPRADEEDAKPEADPSPDKSAPRDPE